MHQSHDPYTITASLEINHWLEQIVRQQALVRIVNVDNNESFLTTLIDANPDEGYLFIDASRDASVNQRFTDASQATLSTQIEHVPLEITVAELQLAEQDRQPYFYCAIPPTIRRFQRRTSFRVQVPKIPPALCRIEHNKLQIEFFVENISTTGVALTTPDTNVPIENNHYLEGSVLELPDFGQLTVDLSVVRTQELSQQDKKTQLLGCSFENLQPQLERDLQHYIFMLQRIEASKKKGFY